MHLIFLIPLMTGLAAGYILKNCADEMAYLTGSVAAFSLILSLVLAPWQLQLLVLMLGLISTKRLLQQNEYRMKTEQNKQEQLND